MSMDIVSLHKHRHKLERRRHHRMKLKLDREKMGKGGGKSPRRALWGSSKEAKYAPVKRSKWKRPGVPRKGEA